MVHGEIRNELRAVTLIPDERLITSVITNLLKYAVQQIFRHFFSGVSTSFVQTSGFLTTEPEKEDNGLW
jgi:hypothetical protein